MLNCEIFYYYYYINYIWYIYYIVKYRKTKNNTSGIFLAKLIVLANRVKNIGYNRETTKNRIKTKILS